MADNRSTEGTPAMQLRARGWGRNMGNTTIADIDLRELRVSRDSNTSIGVSSPGFFDMNGKVSIPWGNTLRLGGD
jgi:hypothetical protein